MNAGRDDEDPNMSGPLGMPWVVWVGLALVTAFALYVGLTAGDQQPGPLDPDSPIPTRPSVIMPVNSWSS